MKMFFVAVVLLWLAACGAPQETLPEEPQPTKIELLLGQGRNVDILTRELPVLAFDWQPHDGRLSEGEEAFLRLVQRLRLKDFYESRDAALVSGNPCRYHRQYSPGTVLVRTARGELWSLTEVEGRYSAHRRSRGWLEASSRLLFSRRYSVYEQDYVVVEARDINRFINFTEVLCPEDGEAYEEAWMEYRFPHLRETVD